MRLGNKKYVKQKYDYILEDEEILFLTIHVAKIILKNKQR